MSALWDEILAEVRNEDLLKFGMIPEFIGRLPVSRDARGARRKRFGAGARGAAQRTHQAIQAFVRA